MADPIELLRAVLPRLGIDQMTHNGHLYFCAFAAPDWLASDTCTCGRDELIGRVVSAINEAGQDCDGAE